MKLGRVKSAKVHYAVSEEYDRDLYSGEPTQEYVTYYTPAIFTPFIMLFPVHRDLPDGVKGLICKSFQLYWMSPESAINCLRSSVECLLDEFSIQKFENIKGKRRSISLHRRLHLFSLQKPSESDLLMAVKWLGNTGSHGTALTHEHVLDAMDILVKVYDMLYDERKIRRSAKAIIKKRGKV